MILLEKSVGTALGLPHLGCQKLPGHFDVLTLIYTHEQSTCELGEANGPCYKSRPFGNRIFDTWMDDYHPWVFASASLSENISGPLRETNTTKH